MGPFGIEELAVLVGVILMMALNLRRVGESRRGEAIIRAIIPLFAGIVVSFWFGFPALLIAMIAVFLWLRPQTKAS